MAFCKGWCLLHQAQNEEKIEAKYCILAYASRQGPHTTTEERFAGCLGTVLLSVYRRLHISLCSIHLLF